MTIPRLNNIQSIAQMANGDIVKEVSMLYDYLKVARNLDSADQTIQILAKKVFEAEPLNTYDKVKYYEMVKNLNSEAIQAWKHRATIDTVTTFIAKLETIESEVTRHFNDEKTTYKLDKYKEIVNLMDHLSSSTKSEADISKISENCNEIYKNIDSIKEMDDFTLSLTALHAKYYPELKEALSDAVKAKYSQLIFSWKPSKFISEELLEKFKGLDGENDQEIMTYIDSIKLKLEHMIPVSKNKAEEKFLLNKAKDFNLLFIDAFCRTYVKNVDPAVLDTSKKEGESTFDWVERLTKLDTNKLLNVGEANIIKHLLKWQETLEERTQTHSTNPTLSETFKSLEKMAEVFLPVESMTEVSRAIATAPPVIVLKKKAEKIYETWGSVPNDLAKSISPHDLDKFKSHSNFRSFVNTALKNKASWLTPFIDVKDGFIAPIQKKMDILTQEGNFEEVLSTSLDALNEGLQALQNASDAEDLVKKLTGDPTMTVEKYNREKNSSIRSNVIKMLKRSSAPKKEKQGFFNAIFRFLKSVKAMITNYLMTTFLENNPDFIKIPKGKKASIKKIVNLKKELKQNNPTLYNLFERQGTWDRLDKAGEHSDILLLHVMEKALETSMNILADNETKLTKLEKDKKIEEQKKKFENSKNELLDTVTSFSSGTGKLSYVTWGISKIADIIGISPKELNWQSEFVNPLRKDWRNWFELS